MGDQPERTVAEKPSINLDRRNFLLQSCRCALLTTFAATFRKVAFGRETNSNQPAKFFLHPHYRTQTALDALLLATAADDSFVSEVHTARIASILETWAAALTQPVPDLTSLKNALASDFRGCSLIPTHSRVVRPGSTLEVFAMKFTDVAFLVDTSFVDDLRTSLHGFTVSSANFEIASLTISSAPEETHRPTSLTTRIRYELIGSGLGTHREQRTGYWQIEWSASVSGEYRARSWKADNESRSRARHPVFIDVSREAFQRTSSYEPQLCHGTDYWRTILDAASGIDIYGHNGVAVGDIDGDGLDDLYICQPAGLPNRLYRNRGDGTFEDVTEQSGVGLLDNTACALFVDIDNDGRQDLIVVRATGPILFQNAGNGRFQKKPNAFKFASPPQGTFTGAAVADYDRDGWLDVYFCLYVYYQGTDQYKYPAPYYAAENGPPNFMFRNQRDGTFHDVTAETGLDRNNTRYSFCCGWSDFNGDGWPDLYVVNDFGRKNLYRNNGDGTFTDVAPQADVEDIGAGMSVCWLDYDNDGRQDLYVADMWTAAGERVSMQDAFQKDMPEAVRALYRKHARGNSLFRNRGDGTFEDASASAGVEMGRWSWSSDAWDFDHDGFPDLYIANGMVSGSSRDDLNSFFWRRVVAVSPREAKPSHEYEQGWTALNELLRADFSWSGYERNVFFANNRNGTFSDVSACVGLDFIEDGRSFALADLDGDGRIEVFLKNRNSPQLRLLKNVMPDLGSSITFRLTGRKSNRDAIGAAVTVKTESGDQTKLLQAGSAFLSQHSKEVHFGLGEARGSVRASVRWPNGETQSFQNLPVNHRISLEEGASEFRAESFRANTFPTISTADNSMSETLPTSFGTWLLAPVASPGFSLQDRSGRTHSLDSFANLRLLLTFVSMASATGRDDIKNAEQIARNGSKSGLRVLAVDFSNSGGSNSSESLPVTDSALTLVQGTDDAAGVYSILYRYLYDRHRDISLPASFLINERGEIIKVVQGSLNPKQIEQDFHQLPQTASARVSKGLPFPGVTDDLEFSRNYLSFGSAYFQRGYYDEAKKSFEHALRDDPESGEGEYGLGSVYLKQGKPADAFTSFTRATKMTAGYPDTLPDAWNNLGLIAAREGRMTEAIEYFKKSLALSPDHMVALVNLGNAYRQQRNWQEARATFEHAVQVGPQDAEANYGLAMVFAQQNDTEHTYQYLQKALELRPSYPEALNNLGILYLRTNQPERAVSSFEESIRVAPEFSQPYLNLAQVYAIQGAPDKARTVLQKLLAQHPDDAQAQAALAQLPK